MLSDSHRPRTLGPAGLVVSRFVAFVALLAVLLVVTACLSPSGGDGDIPELGGPQYSALMVSSDLAKGNNRLIFALVDRNNVPVNAGTANVAPMFTPPGGAGPQAKEAITAHFLSWPPEGSGRGVFVAEIEFDVAGEATRQNPGLWELRVSATDVTGAAVEATTAVRVREHPATPAIGLPAPRSDTPTFDQVDDLAEISSDPTPDPGFYQLSVAEALDVGKPLVVLFSTPAFCVSATCGPQLDVLQSLKERYEGRVNFIHVEVFQDPHLIEGNRFAATKVPAVEEWGLPSEPWTFVMDQDGLVQAKFEQFTPESLLDETLTRLLGS
ncbi:MAG: hypothetical protein OXI91_09455 [Chloroflexota bacterium]|nr:hypothetical protein [Chloroflexota bacterium]